MHMLPVNFRFMAASSLLALALAVPFSASAQSGAARSNATAAASPQAGSATEQGAYNFVKSMVDQGLGFLASRDLTQAQKTESFRKLLDGSFDLDTIARFSLGRYWNTASEAQRSEYLSLFRKMIVDVYSNRFDQYKGQTVSVRASRPVSDQDTLVTSAMMSPAGGPEVQVAWRVRGKNGNYKIVDVLVEGVSMSVTQRADFASVIQRGGGNVEALLTQLRKGSAPTPAAR